MRSLKCAYSAGYTAHVKREFAHFRGFDTSRCSDGELWATLVSSLLGSSKPTGDVCQHRYPSPSRSTFLESRSTPPLTWALAILRLLFARTFWSRLSVPTFDGSRTSIESRSLCQSLPFFFRSLWRVSDCPAALKPTANAPLSGRRAVVLRMKSCLTAIASMARLSARSVVPFWTTSPDANTYLKSLGSATWERPRVAFCVLERP